VEKIVEKRVFRLALQSNCADSGRDREHGPDSPAWRVIRP
jgi:hypothetical protein